MSSDIQNFDPFYDWSSITQEMADDLHRDFRKHKENLDALVASEQPDISLAAAVMESLNEIQLTSEAIRKTVWTQPVMVHIAGSRKHETNPDNPNEEAVLQRCSRCGSVLNFWQEGMMSLTEDGPRQMEEDEIPWWDQGALIGKVNGSLSISTYLIEEGRDLEKHEMECPSLMDLDG